MFNSVLFCVAYGFTTLSISIVLLFFQSAFIWRYFVVQRYAKKTNIYSGIMISSAIVFHAPLTIRVVIIFCLIAVSDQPSAFSFFLAIRELGNKVMR